jgi:hypothetical protein
MRNSLYIFCIILMFTCSCKSRSKTGDTTAGKEIAREYYSDGTIKTETESKNGKANGLMKTFDRDGNISSVYTFVDGVREGPAVSYYPSGELETKMYYSKGFREGITLWYYKTGELFREIPYNAGKVNGIKKSYYKDGKLQAEAPHLNGYPGLGLKEYNSKGQLISDPTKIIVKQINQVAQNKRIILEISLSKAHPETSFYQGDLAENKYLCQELWPIANENGKAEYIISIPPSGILKATYTFSASYPTSNSSIMVLSRNYSVSVGR